MFSGCHENILDKYQELHAKEYVLWLIRLVIFMLQMEIEGAYIQGDPRLISALLVLPCLCLDGAQLGRVYVEILYSSFFFSLTLYDKGLISFFNNIFFLTSTAVFSSLYT